MTSIDKVVTELRKKKIAVHKVLSWAKLIKRLEEPVSKNIGEWLIEN